MPKVKASQWFKRSWCLGAGSPGFKSDLEQIIVLICENTEPAPCLLASQGHGGRLCGLESSGST